MKTQPTYIKEFQNYDSAYSFMKMKNKASRNEVFCLVTSASGNYAVVDLRTAIELGNGYTFS